MSGHGEILCAASFAVLRRFNHMKVPEPIAVETCNRGGKGFEWVVVRHVVEAACGRDSHAHLPALPDLEHAFHGLKEKADSIRRRASIFVGSPIRSCSKKLIDQV